MAWNLPATPNPGDVATVANFATPTIDSLRYLKGLDGNAALDCTQLLRNGTDSSYLEIMGGDTYGALVTAFGKNHATYPGAVRFIVPNAAKTGWVEAARWEGATNTPTMTAGVIPMARLQKYALGSFQGNSSGATRQITTGFTATMLILLGLDFNGTDAAEVVWTSFTAVASIYHKDGNVVARSTSVHLHATDGFSVGAADNEGNVTGINYYYLVL